MPQTIDTQFINTPAGSICLQPLEQHTDYLRKLGKTSGALKMMLTSVQTGAYLTGVTRTYNLPKEATSTLAFFVLLVGIGEASLAQLPAMLSSQLKLANDKAQAIAQEIERELFAPIMLEYNKSLRAQQAAASPSLRPSTGAQNVLNLKQAQPSVPKKPSVFPSPPLPPSRPPNMPF